MTQVLDVADGRQLGYATPGYAGPSPVWAGFWVLAGGLVMIFLGGCFCIGVLMLVTFDTSVGFKPSSSPGTVWAFRHTALMCVLYAVAFACFAAGATMLVAAVRKLLSVGRG